MTTLGPLKPEQCPSLVRDSRINLKAENPIKSKSETKFTFQKFHKIGEDSGFLVYSYSSERNALRFFFCKIRRSRAEKGFFASNFRSGADYRFENFPRKQIRTKSDFRVYPKILCRTKQINPMIRKSDYKSRSGADS